MYIRGLLLVFCLVSGLSLLRLCGLVMVMLCILDIMLRWMGVGVFMCLVIVLGRCLLFGW